MKSTLIAILIQLSMPAAFAFQPEYVAVIVCGDTHGSVTVDRYEIPESTLEKQSAFQVVASGHFAEELRSIGLAGNKISARSDEVIFDGLFLERPTRFVQYDHYVELDPHANPRIFVADIGNHLGAEYPNYVPKLSISNTEGQIVIVENCARRN